MPSSVCHVRSSGSGAPEASFSARSRQSSVRLSHHLVLFDRVTGTDGCFPVFAGPVTSDQFGQARCPRRAVPEQVICIGFAEHSGLIPVKRQPAAITGGYRFGRLRPFWSGSRAIPTDRGRSLQPFTRHILSAGRLKTRHRGQPVFGQAAGKRLERMYLDIGRCACRHGAGQVGNDIAPAPFLRGETSQLFGTWYGLPLRHGLRR